MNILTLTSDFGTRDGYIGSLKGVISSSSLDINVVDITHDIKPYSIAQAAYSLFISYSYYPSNTVHVVIVDPKVGSERPILFLKANDQIFIGPDNGVFDPIVYGHEDYKSYAIDVTKFVNVSRTFHGRDIFVPAALKYIGGEEIKNFTNPHEYKFRLLTEEMMDGTVAVVLHSDHFGNIVTAINQKKTGERRIKSLQFEHIEIPFVQYYNQGEPGKPVCLFGSSGLLEIAIDEDNAERFFTNRWGGLPSEFDIVWD